MAAKVGVLTIEWGVSCRRSYKESEERKLDRMMSSKHTGELEWGQEEKARAAAAAAAKVAERQRIGTQIVANAGIAVIAKYVMGEGREAERWAQIEQRRGLTPPRRYRPKAPTLRPPRPRVPPVVKARVLAMLPSGLCRRVRLDSGVAHWRAAREQLPVGTRAGLSMYRKNGTRGTYLPLYRVYMDSPAWQTLALLKRRFGSRSMARGVLPGVDDSRRGRVVRLARMTRRKGWMSPARTSPMWTHLHADLADEKVMRE